MKAKARRSPILWGLGLLGIVGIGMVSLGTSAAPSSNPTSEYPPKTLVSQDVEGSVAGRAASNVLQLATGTSTVRKIRTAQQDYDEIDARDAAGNGYDVIVFHRFSVAELDGAGFAKSTTADGTFWVGADDATFKDVYFVPSSGAVAVSISTTNAAGAAHSVSALNAAAVDLMKALGR